MFSVKVKKLVASSAIILLMCSNFVANGDSMNNAGDDAATIIIPKGKIGTMNQDAFCTFLLSQKIFQQSLPAGHELSKIIHKFKNEEIDFYPIFLAHKEELAKSKQKKSEWTPEARLLALYRMLWIFQDKKQHKNIYNYLDSLSDIQQSAEILNLLTTHGASVFDEKAYPYLERQIIGCCTPGNPLWEQQAMLEIILEESSNIFKPNIFENLVDVAVEMTSTLAFSQKNMYDNYFFTTTKYAGRKSMPYFVQYFENECSQFNLFVIAEYFKRNLDDTSYKNLLLRKIKLLRESATALESEINK